MPKAGILSWDWPLIGPGLAYVSLGLALLLSQDWSGLAGGSRTSCGRWWLRPCSWPQGCCSARAAPPEEAGGNMERLSYALRSAWPWPASFVVMLLHGDFPTYGTLFALLVSILAIVDLVRGAGIGGAQAPGPMPGPPRPWPSGGGGGLMLFPLASYGGAGPGGRTC